MSVFRRLSAIAGLTAIAVFSTPARSGPRVDMTCEPRPGSRDSCAPIIACLGGTGIYFTGRAIGWNTGTFAGTTNAGFSCTGKWTARNAFGLGQAVFECDNGRNGIAFFTYRDSLTGTATGHGMMDDGRVIRMWSGHEIEQFIINQSGDVNARLMCGDVPVPIS